MTDTSFEVQRLVRDRIMARSGQERLIIAAEMFEAARTMILSSFPAGLPEEERRRRLYHRIYGETLPG